uniref:Uncharacterized protein n=1 Tax=Arundo donax TaxID=35708 RepID=A0A0A8Y2A7_ARUDO
MNICGRCVGGMWQRRRRGGGELVLPYWLWKLVPRRRIPA